MLFLLERRRHKKLRALFDEMLDQVAAEREQDNAERGHGDEPRSGIYRADLDLMHKLADLI